MARRGKPREMHLVDGTHNVTRHGDPDELRREMRERKAARLPEPPRWLPAYAKAEWRRVAGILRERGMLTPADRAALACYCRAWSELRDAQRAIETEGRTVETATGSVKLNPAVTVANAAVRQIRDFSIEFGLSPTARARFGPPPKGGDELDRFIRENADRNHQS